MCENCFSAAGDHSAVITDPIQEISDRFLGLIQFGKFRNVKQATYWYSSILRQMLQVLTNERKVLSYKLQNPFL